MAQFCLIGTAITTEHTIALSKHIKSLLVKATVYVSKIIEVMAKCDVDQSSFGTLKFQVVAWNVAHRKIILIFIDVVS